MIKKLKIYLLVIMFFVANFIYLTATARADASNLNLWTGNTKSDLTQNVGFANADLERVTINIIKLAIGFLGLIAVIIIVVGGFKWMTSGGSEEKVTGARKLMVAGIIGLVIIIISFAIASFVINQITNVIGG